MQFKSMIVSVSEALSATGTSIAAQSFSKDLVRATQAKTKVDTQVVQPWLKSRKHIGHAFFQPKTHSLKMAARMYNHGIKRI